jgi:hypothetical protein
VLISRLCDIKMNNRRPTILDIKKAADSQQSVNILCAKRPQTAKHRSLNNDHFLILLFFL